MYTKAEIISVPLSTVGIKIEIDTIEDLLEIISVFDYEKRKL